MPFCVQEFEIYDDKNQKCLKQENNHETIYKAFFQEGLYTSELRLVMKRKLENIPIALFGIDIR